MYYKTVHILSIIKLKLKKIIIYIYDTIIIKAGQIIYVRKIL